MTGESGKYYIGNKVSGKQSLLMESLTGFFTENKMSTILPILNGKSNISLRIIDWFVTNYAKKNNIIYYIKNDKNSKKKRSLKNKSKSKYFSEPPDNSYLQIIVYLNYKSQLKAYSKKQFDPFCRRDRIEFFYGKNKSIVTTVGQLNFFRWSLETNVIEYITEHLSEIEDDMNTNIRKTYPKTKKKTIDEKADRKKRKELSVCATKNLNKHSASILLNFD